MKHVMVDLETLGTVPGCALLSIGAVFFDATGLGAEFYTVVSLEDCKAHDLHVDPDTEKWWSRQSTSAKQVLKDAAAPDAPTLEQALKMFGLFLKLDTSVKVWGNGADFDNPILAVAYHRKQLKQAWVAYNGRCYRTVKNIAPGPKLERSGTHHNALDDAKSQAQHMIELFALHPSLVLA